MISTSLPQEAGGFLRPTLPSPPPSSRQSPLSPSSALPEPRSYPLKPGGSKESSLINYIDRKLLEISRRYEKRFGEEPEEHNRSAEGKGYRGFGGVAKDLENVVDVVWVSGTPSLQTPYLLTIALALTTYLPSFPFVPQETFSLLHKLDVAFSSLLQGHNVENGGALPGFEGGRGKLSTTEKVRMRGIVLRTRIAVVEMAGKSVHDGEITSILNSTPDTEGGLTTDEDIEMDDFEDDDDNVEWEMDVARVYERTIADLGVALDAL